MLNQESKTEPQNSHIIRVIGVGGGGSNAVNYMFGQEIEKVDFMVCNTDLQALEDSPVPYKIQIGVELTEGLGAGAKPDAGKKAALENEAELRQALEGAQMIFITAGMGGGTGTGAAPVIASIAKEMGILAVGIVTIPFKFEGTPKKKRALEGIAELRENCDAVIEILNDRLQDIYGNFSWREAFSKADMILSQAALGISEGIYAVGTVNIDFQDVKTAVSNAGSAVMGVGIANGDGRAVNAVDQALNSPLLNHTNIRGSKYIILITKVRDFDSIQMEELEELTNYLQKESGEKTELIWGAICQEELGDNIGVTIIATGFEEQAARDNLGSKSKKAQEKVSEEPDVVIANQEDIEIKSEQESEDKLSNNNVWDLDPKTVDEESYEQMKKIPAYKRLRNNKNDDNDDS